MKAIGALLLALALSPCAWAAGLAPDRERDGLKGPVKSVRVETVTGTAQPETRVPFSEVSYDAAGNTVERKYHTDDGNVVVETWTARPTGTREIHATKPADSGSGFRTTRLKPQPEAGAPLIRARDGLYLFLRSFVLDPQGRVAMETLQSGIAADPTKAVTRTQFTYDAKGRIAEFSILRAQANVLAERHVLTYGRRDEVVQEFVYGPGNVQLKRMTYGYEFDDQGNWTRMTTTHVGDDAGRIEIKVRTITYESAAK